MRDMLDWITAIATVVLVYAALRYPLYPPGGNAADDRCRDEAERDA